MALLRSSSGTCFGGISFISFPLGSCPVLRFHRYLSALLARMLFLRVFRSVIDGVLRLVGGSYSCWFLGWCNIPR